MFTQHIIIVYVYHKNKFQNEEFQFFAPEIDKARERYECWYERNKETYEVLSTKEITTQRG